MSSSLDVLDWPLVTHELTKYCQTPHAKARCELNDVFLPTPDDIQNEMARVTETKTLLRLHPEPTYQNVLPNVEDTLKKLAKQGECYSVAELSELLVGLKAYRQMARFFIQHRSKEMTPHLVTLLETITLPNTAIDVLDSKVNEEGQWLDAASPEYQQLTQSIRSQRDTIHETLQTMINRPPTNKYVQEPVISEREGRFVLPIKVEHKADVPGVSHGVSSSGWTFYIEPQVVVEKNNSLLGTQAKLFAEIQRLLKTTSEALWPLADDALVFLSHVSTLDLLMAKAKLSKAWDANAITLFSPEVVPTHHWINLIKARHPILLMQQTPVIANTVRMEQAQRIMIITGPNTGGKTVVLKMVGLFALLIQAGCHIPAEPESVMPIFTHILADIGDTQSITHNLSTFSGHIHRVQSFFDTPELSASLVILDEVCAGTDPDEGTSLAKAILSRFESEKATVLVSTHLGALKRLAYENPHYVNAAVAFDDVTLKPLYQLHIGISGTSQALSIAQTLGLDPNVVNMANAFLSEQPASTWHLMSSLEAQSVAMSKAMADTEQAKTQAIEQETQAQELRKAMEDEKRKTVTLYRERLKERLNKVESSIDSLRKQLHAAKQPTEKQLLHIEHRIEQLKNKGEGILDEADDRIAPQPHIPWDKITIGDKVRCRNNAMVGFVVEKIEHKHHLLLQSGILKTQVSITDVIEKLEQAPAHVKRSASVKTPAGNVKRAEHGDKQAARFHGLSVSCDVRGMRQDDALGVLDKVLDEALLEGVPQVEIVHGLGTGALKKAIRDHLLELPYVKKYEPAQATDGGDGKTIVYLN